MASAAAAAASSDMATSAANQWIDIHRAVVGVVVKFYKHREREISSHERVAKLMMLSAPDLQELFSATATRDTTTAFCDDPSKRCIYIVGTFARTAPFFVTEARFLWRQRSNQSFDTDDSAAPQLVHDKLVCRTLEGLDSLDSRGDIDVFRVRITRQYIPETFEPVLSSIQALGRLTAHLGTYRSAPNSSTAPKTGVVKLATRVDEAKRVLAPLQEMMQPIVQFRGVDGTAERIAGLSRGTPIPPQQLCEYATQRLENRPWSPEWQTLGELGSPLAWHSASPPTFAELAFGIDLITRLRALEPATTKRMLLELSERRVCLEIFFVRAYAPEFLRALYTSDVPSAQQHFVKAVPGSLFAQNSDSNGVVITNTMLHELHQTFIKAHTLCTTMCDMVLYSGHAYSCVGVLAYRASLINAYPPENRLFNGIADFVTGLPHAKQWRDALLLLFGEPIDHDVKLQNAVFHWVNKKKNVFTLAFVHHQSAELVAMLRPFAWRESPVEHANGTTAAAATTTISESELDHCRRRPHASVNHHSDNNQASTFKVPSRKRLLSSNELFTRNAQTINNSLLSIACDVGSAQYEVLGESFVAQMRAPERSLILKPYFGEPPQHWLAFLKSMPMHLDAVDPKQHSHNGQLVRPTYLVLSARNVDQRDANTQYYSAFVAADSRLTADFCADVRVLVFLGSERLDYVCLLRALSLFNLNSLRKLVFLYDYVTMANDSAVIDARQLCEDAASKRLLYGHVVKDLFFSGLVTPCEACPPDLMMRSPVVSALSQLRGGVDLEGRVANGHYDVLNLQAYDASNTNRLHGFVAELSLRRDAAEQLAAPALFVLVSQKHTHLAERTDPLVTRLVTAVQTVHAEFQADMPDYKSLREISPCVEQFLRFAAGEKSILRRGDIVSWVDKTSFAVLPPQKLDYAEVPRICSSAGLYFIHRIVASVSTERNSSELELQSISRDGRDALMRLLYPQRASAASFPDVYIHFELLPLDSPMPDLREKLQRTLRVSQRFSEILLPFRFSPCVTVDQLGMLGPVENLVVLYDADAFDGAERVLQAMHYAAQNVMILASDRFADGKLQATATYERRATVDRIDYYSPLAESLRR